jgi:hypothetical protein
MSTLKVALRPYSLEAARKSAGASGVRCVTIDVGRDQSGNPVSSLEFLRAEVDRYLFNDRGRGISARKLFIVGDWNLGRPKVESVNVVPDERTQSEVRFDIASPSPLDWPATRTSCLSVMLNPSIETLLAVAYTDAYRPCKKRRLPKNGRKASASSVDLSAQ